LLIESNYSQYHLIAFIFLKIAKLDHDLYGAPVNYDVVSIPHSLEFYDKPFTFIKAKA
jgi:hypothetical protein